MFSKVKHEKQKRISAGVALSLSPFADLLLLVIANGALIVGHGLWALNTLSQLIINYFILMLSWVGSSTSCPLKLLKCIIYITDSVCQMFDEASFKNWNFQSVLKLKTVSSMNVRTVGILDMKNDQKMTWAKLRFHHSTSGHHRERSLRNMVLRFLREWI